MGLLMQEGAQFSPIRRRPPVPVTDSVRVVPLSDLKRLHQMMITLIVMSAINIVLDIVLP